jgi:hypothetical protein
LRGGEKVFGDRVAAPMRSSAARAALDLKSAENLTANILKP